MLNRSIDDQALKCAFSFLRQYPVVYDIVAIALAHDLSLWQVLACTDRDLYRDARTGGWTLRVLKPLHLSAKERSERQPVYLFPPLSIVAERMVSRKLFKKIHPFRNCEQLISYIDKLSRGNIPRDAIRREAIYNMIDPLLVFPNEQNATNKA